MMTACYAVRFRGRAETWSYCPGYVATNLDTVGGPAAVAAAGAGDPSTGVQGILDILLGRRDDETELMVTRNAGTFLW
ncbi:hypothetical protein GMORB2_4374 [Geosmithia morbida]|uniref:Uncharacterized protein n=1 Tax=Geosmithia morbida TaxID=1094350 RepID=A0A9P4YMI2_9HYPO|nr:uncharacterized protein GMORB2_4374 [Geosmithia morbida]KAF4119708.1 hypothetical protein GMORB2_4374 [Geosmithia morbida]